MKKLILALVLLGRGFCAAGDTSSVAASSAVGIMESDGLKFLHAAGYIFSSPARWNGADWMRFGAAGAGTAAVSGLDIDTRLFMQRHQSAGSGNITDVAVQYGAGVNLIALSAGGYIAGLAFENRWLRETSLLAGSAIVLSGTISTVTKIVVGRARPYTGRGHAAFKPFSFTVDDFASFPSGHTIVAFAFSGVLAERIGNTWASIGLYGLAASCGISRLYEDQHWVSDVFFGAVISVSVSRSLVRWFESGGDDSGGSGLRIVPGAQTITLVWTF